VRGAVTIKSTALLIPPPGGGLATVTLAVVAELTAMAEIEAVSCLLLTNVVG
jgi:hypothetical protein